MAVIVDGAAFLCGGTWLAWLSTAMSPILWQRRSYLRRVCDIGSVANGGLESGQVRDADTDSLRRYAKRSQLCAGCSVEMNEVVAAGVKRLMMMIDCDGLRRKLYASAGANGERSLAVPRKGAPMLSHGEFKVDTVHVMGHVATCPSLVHCPVADAPCIGLTSILFMQILEINWIIRDAKSSDHVTR